MKPLINSLQMGKYNEAESQKAYDEVNKLWEANKALKFETSDSQSKYKGTSYDNLNKNVGNYMDNLRKANERC